MNMTAVRAQFPALSQKIRNSDLCYLDSAATSLKPQCVIDRLVKYYSYENSNVHRGGHYLGAKATENYEGARKHVATFLNSSSEEEIVFTRGTTESINLVAQSWGSANLKKDDVILVTTLEHHANIVPWQMVAQKTGAKVVPVPILDSGLIDEGALDTLLTSQVKMFALTHCSNAIGTMTNAKELVKKAKAVGAATLIDGAQMVANRKVDVRDLDCDFYVFSGHKIFAPTGIGVLYGRKEILSEMPPYQGGGSMISVVSFEGTTYQDIPTRFEAGTPHISGAIGLGEALRFFSELDLSSVQAHESALVQKAVTELRKIDGVKVYGHNPGAEWAPLVSFNLAGAHHSDVAQILDEQGVAVRSGHHCAMPLMARLSVSGTVRASFSIYNSEKDVERLIAGVKKAKEILL